MEQTHQIKEIVIEQQQDFPLLIIAWDWAELINFGVKIESETPKDKITQSILAKTQDGFSLLEYHFTDQKDRDYYKQMAEAIKFKRVSTEGEDWSGGAWSIIRLCNAMSPKQFNVTEFRNNLLGSGY